MRKITIHLRDYVDDSRRRERRRGALVAIGAVLVTLFAAGAFRPTETKEGTDTSQTTDTTTTTDTTQTTQTTETTQTTDTTSTTIALTPAKLFVEPTGFGFLRQLPGTRSDPGLVTVRNDGQEPLSTTSVRVEGTGFELLKNDCTAPLPQGATCSVTLVFAPQVPDRQSATLVIETNGGTARIALTGNAIPFPPFDLGTIDFGRQLIGRHVPPRTVRFTNQSAVPVNVAIRTITPETSPFAPIGEPCGVVAPDGGCDVTIVFTPQQGAWAAELRILDPNQALLGFARLTGIGVLQDGPFTFNPALLQRPTKKQ